MSSLPDYVLADTNNLKDKHSLLRKKAQTLNFPLSQEDLKDIKTVIQKFDSDKKLVGLAAPEIGISKRIVIIEVPDIFIDEIPFPRITLINPTYVKENDDREKDYEQCRAVKDMIGPVRRYLNIRYKGYTLDGDYVEKIVEGHAARVIQHEIDHLDGILFTDRVPKGRLSTMKEFLRSNDYIGEGEYYNSET